MPRMKFIEYAKHRGVHPPAISLAAKQGKITVFIDDAGKKYVDSELADAELDGNTDQAMVRGKTALEQVAEETAARKQGEAPVSYAASRAAKERFNAELARLKFEEQSGKLVDASVVQDEAFKLGRTVRDQLMALPDRLSAEIAAETNAFKIHQRLTDEIRRALEALKVE